MATQAEQWWMEAKAFLEWQQRHGFVNAPQAQDWFEDYQTYIEPRVLEKEPAPTKGEPQ